MSEETAPKLEPGKPYCGNCGYHLEGLTESAKCPECGRPLVEVLRRAGGFPNTGKRYTSKATVLGMPAIHLAFGPRDGEPQGKARGFIAIGDDAVGVLAIGGLARGVVAIGGAAFGVFSIGGFAGGILSALGGGAVSLGLAVGGGAIGGIAKAGGAAGFIADGGGAMGFYARGGGAFGRHALGQNPGASSAEATALFDELAWLLGPALSVEGILRTVGFALLFPLLFGGVVALIGWNRDRQAPRGADELR